MLTEKDKKLIERIINKNEKALFGFYQEQKSALFNFILRKTNDQELSEEILQDVFLSFIEGLRDFRGQSSLKTFLYSIAKHKIVDAFRKRKIKRILFSHLPKGLIESFLSIVAEDDLNKKFLIKKIEKVFYKLPNDYSMVLRLKYKEGYKVAEIAEIIKSSFKATESLIFRARKAFIKIYNRL